jgi:hypothetical protein
MKSGGEGDGTYSTPVEKCVCDDDDGDSDGHDASFSQPITVGLVDINKAVHLFHLLPTAQHYSLYSKG